MKNIIKLITTSNRILMLVFSVLLILGAVGKNYLGYAALFAIPLGLFQIGFFLISLRIRTVLEHSERRIQIGYITVVFLYFLMWYLESKTIVFLPNDVLMLVYIIPICLAITITFLLEMIVLKNKT